MKSSVPVSRGIESLFGTRDENMRLIETGLGVSTRLSSDTIEIEGEPDSVARAERILQDYFALGLGRRRFQKWRSEQSAARRDGGSGCDAAALVNSGKHAVSARKFWRPKTVTQRRYLEAIERNDLVFGIGPAGTGKTYLAVAMAISGADFKKGQPDYSDAASG